MLKDDIQITLRYKGKEVDDGTMSVEDFIPALQGFASAYGKISLLKELDYQHKLRITGIQKGSLDILLEVWKAIGENAQQLQALGAVTAGGAAIVMLILEVIKMKKHVEDKPYTEKISATNSIIITNSQNIDLEFPLEVFNLFKDKLIDSDLAKLVKPLEKDRIDKTEIIAKYDGKTVSQDISVSEKPYFDTTIVDATQTKEVWLNGKFNSLTKSTNKGFLNLTDGTRVSYQFAIEKPENFYKYFIYNGLVKVRCIAHLDENLRVSSIDIYEVQEIQPSLLEEKNIKNDKD